MKTIEQLRKEVTQSGFMSDDQQSILKWLEGAYLAGKTDVLNEEITRPNHEDVTNQITDGSCNWCGGRGRVFIKRPDMVKMAMVNCGACGGTGKARKATA